MQMLKMRVQKEDGRYLVYYHFPESANAEETAVFERIEAYQEAENATLPPASTTSAASPSSEKE